MKFSEVKPKIKNLANFKTLKEIKEASLRITYNKKDDSYWLIEEEFLKPVIKSPRECKSILINPEDLKFKIFMCHKSETELKGTHALKYIKWGERQGFNKSATCCGRKHWWDLGIRKATNINCNYLVNEVMRFYFCKVFVSDDFQEIHLESLQNVLELILNSTLVSFFSSMLGRSSFGGGLLKIQTYEVREILIVKPELFTGFTSTKVSDNLLNKIGQRNIAPIFKECGFNPRLPIRDQEPKPLPYRKKLDNIIFDILGLTKQERKEVYWAVCELVKNRLEKAKSVR